MMLIQKIIIDSTPQLNQLGSTPFIGSLDLHLFAEGTHWRIYEKLGAHPHVQHGKSGYHFAVWAPNARSVSVVSDFNHWDGRQNVMERLGGSGVWSVFIENFPEDGKYKFEIHDANGHLRLKADPYANRALIPEFGTKPHEVDLNRTASVTTNLDTYQWQDSLWITDRRQFDVKENPMSIYEVHLGSWMQTLEGQYLDYKALAHKLVDYVQDLGYTHIEFLPIMEYPYHGSWGYQVTSFFALTSRFGSPQEFMYLVDLCHQNGIGVLMDWVPCHFPKDEIGLRRFDGTALYEPEGWQDGEVKAWGTHTFNTRRHEVSNFLIASALFWLEKYHLDGLRVDAIAYMISKEHGRGPGDWLPNDYGGQDNLDSLAFVRKLNKIVHQRVPGVIMIAEDSSNFCNVTAPAGQKAPLEKWLIDKIPFSRDHLSTFFNKTGSGLFEPVGSLPEQVELVLQNIVDRGLQAGWIHVMEQAFGLGFDLKWDMGWMNDLLSWRGDEKGFVRMDPLYRKHHLSKLLFRTVYQHNERYAMPISHDEVVHGKGSVVNKMPGDLWQKFAQTRLLYAWMFGLPGKKVLFQGHDIGQLSEWDQLRSVDWHVLNNEYPNLGKAHAKLQDLVRDLNRLYRSHPALMATDHIPSSFQWINAQDTDRQVFSFLRTGKNPQDILLAMFNFTPMVRRDYWVGAPVAGSWREVLNTDHRKYSGSGVTNDYPLNTSPVGHDNQAQKLILTVPPFGATFLEPIPAHLPTGV